MVIFFLRAVAQAQGYYPQPEGFVNDFEFDFSKDQVKALDASVRSLLSQTMEKEELKGIELAVLTVTDSMFGTETEMSSYATKIGDKWGVGTKTPNRGIIIAYSKKLRKVAIVTGTGLDKLLPAQAIRQIIDERMAEEFRKGKPFDALMVAVKGIGEYLGIIVK